MAIRLSVRDFDRSSRELQSILCIDGSAPERQGT